MQNFIMRFVNFCSCSGYTFCCTCAKWHPWKTTTETHIHIILNLVLPRIWEMASGHRRSGDMPVVGHLPTGFTRSAVTHTGVTATEALQLAEDRPFWRTIAMAGDFGWTLCVMVMMIDLEYGCCFDSQSPAYPEQWTSSQTRPKLRTCIVLGCPTHLH